MDLIKLKNDLSRDVEELGYHLFSVDFFKNDGILQVLIDESLDLDGISRVSEKISTIMDRYDGDWGRYILDVGSVGAERPIRCEEEVIRAVGSYVNVKSDVYSGDGDLVSYKDGVLSLRVKDKNLRKTVTLDYKAVKKMRYAVKF